MEGKQESQGIRNYDHMLLLLLSLELQERANMKNQAITGITLDPVQ